MAYQVENIAAALPVQNDHLKPKGCIDKYISDIVIGAIY